MSGVTKYLLHSQEHKYREKNLDCEDCKIEMKKRKGESDEGKKCLVILQIGKNMLDLSLFKPYNHGVSALP
jgi:hypothetical protein